jgi:hypothetical protein
MTVSGTIFRSETLFLMGFYCLFELFKEAKLRNIGFIISLIKLGIITMGICLGNYYTVASYVLLLSIYF